MSNLAETQPVLYSGLPHKVSDQAAKDHYKSKKPLTLQPSCCRPPHYSSGMVVGSRYYQRHI